MKKITAFGLNKDNRKDIHERLETMIEILEQD